MFSFKPVFNFENLLKSISKHYVLSNQYDNIHTQISSHDCVMSSFACFYQNFSSLLKFDENRVQKNLFNKILEKFGISRSPCDTHLRTRNSKISLNNLTEDLINKFNSMVLNKNMLEDFKYYDNKFLVNISSIIYFKSKKIKCEKCTSDIIKNKKYHTHKAMFGSIISPNLKQVIPLVNHQIEKISTKKRRNHDQENALNGKKTLELMKNLYPNLSFVVTGDENLLNKEFLNNLNDGNYQYILQASKIKHQTLFKLFDEDNGDRQYLNNIKFKKAIDVNLLYFRDELGIKKIFVTNLEINDANFDKILQSGLAQWKIEDKRFNNFESMGINYDHNYGHGVDGLGDLFFQQMLLSFLMKQMLEIAGILLQKLKDKFFYLLLLVKEKFDIEKIMSYEELTETIVNPPPN